MMEQLKENCSFPCLQERFEKWWKWQAKLLNIYTASIFTEWLKNISQCLCLKDPAVYYSSSYVFPQ